LKFKILFKLFIFRITEFKSKAQNLKFKMTDSRWQTDTKFLYQKKFYKLVYHIEFAILNFKCRASDLNLAI